MTDNVEIRESLPDDAARIEELYRAAFPDEDLYDLVRELLSQKPAPLSLAGISGGTAAGHAVFTACGIAGRTEKAALMGPLAVAPGRRRQGIGGAIVDAGMQRLKNAGIDRVCVLGDPAYYGRFGFAAEDGIEPPYRLPDEWRGAWQSLSLCDDRRSVRGKLCVPQPWRRQALWAP